MNTTALKIKRWKKTQTKLFSFIKADKVVKGDEIRNWITDSIVHFNELKMQSYIVESFLSKLDYIEKEIEVEILFPTYLAYTGPDKEKKTLSSIGPFVFNDKLNGYKIDSQNRLTGQVGGMPHLTPLLVAFKVAQNIIDNYEEEERIIPKSLLNEFDTENTQGIFISLRGIQDSYEKRNIRNILASIITTTELICKLIPELDSKRNLIDKLNKIHSDETILKKYSINKEVIWSLNNSRIIRNYDSHIPKKENHTTIHEVVGYCHLLVLFIASILSSGKIILNK